MVNGDDSYCPDIEYRRAKEQAEEYLTVWRKPASLTAGLNYYRANRSGPPDGDDGEPRKIAQTVVMEPTLVIWGDKDVYFTPDNVDLMRDVVPDLTVRRYPHNDHWSVHQRPRDIADLTMACVDRKLVKRRRAVKQAVLGPVDKGWQPELC